MPGTYRIVSGSLFGAVAIAQLARAVMALPVQIGGVDIPITASWIAAAVLGGLCVWAFNGKG